MLVLNNDDEGIKNRSMHNHRLAYENKGNQGNINGYISDLKESVFMKLYVIWLC